MAWIKCPSCRKVVDDEGHSCKPAPKRKRTPGSSKDSVAAHRERTGNAYGKAYAKARAAAVKQLIEENPERFAVLLEKARVDAGLGPTRRS